MRSPLNRWLAAPLLAAATVAQAVAAPDPAPANPASAIVACMRANIPTAVQVKEVELIARDRVGGERLLRGRLYSTREQQRFRAMLKVSAPQDLAGAAYLTREAKAGDEFFVYVPALNKVRRITGSSIDGSLWGTDLSYGDLRQLQNAFSDADAKLEGKSRLEQRPVDVLVFTPRPEEASRYRQMRAWVDQKTCMALKIEFLEPAGLRKRMSGKPKDLQQSGDHWYLAEMLVEDVKEGTQTRLKVKGVKIVDHLANHYFNPTTFYLGP